MPKGYQVIDFREDGKKRRIKRYPARALYQTCYDSRQVVMKYFKLTDFDDALEHPILVNPEQDVVQFHARSRKAPLHAAPWFSGYTNHLRPKNMADELSTVVFFLGNQRLSGARKLVDIASVFRGLEFLVIVREKGEPHFLNDRGWGVFAKTRADMDWITADFNAFYTRMLYERRSLLTNDGWLHKLVTETFKTGKGPTLIWLDRATYKKRMRSGNGIQGLLGNKGTYLSGTLNQLIMANIGFLQPITFHLASSKFETYQGVLRKLD